MWSGASRGGGGENRCTVNVYPKAFRRHSEGEGVVLTIRALLDSSAGGVVTHTALEVLRHPVVVAGVDLPAGYGACTAHGASFVRRRPARPRGAEVLGAEGQRSAMPPAGLG